ncbi:MAG: prepilin peptidase [Planctomycetes bacterium]|nr:prepilin peptidase [Planctomycetota bacterium]
MDEVPRQVLVVFAGLFGLLVGSFLNVCIFRLPRRCMSIAGGRSKCPRCRRTIAWYDNIPVLSWIALGGKCRGCRAAISPRYALIELATGGLFAYAAAVQLYRPALEEPVQRATLFAIQCYLVGAIVASTFIDIDFEILPDEINLTGIPLGLLAGAAFPEVLFGEMPLLGWLERVPEGVRPHLYGAAQSVAGAMIGGGLLWAVSILGTAVFRKRVRELKMDSAMGFGDVKYLAFLGAFLGWQGILLAFLVSVLSGALYGLGKFAFTRSFGKVPFGPFLSVGALSVMFARPLIVRGVEAYLELFRPAA